MKGRVPSLPPYASTTAVPDKRAKLRPNIDPMIREGRASARPQKSPRSLLVFALHLTTSLRWYIHSCFFSSLCVRSATQPLCDHCSTGQLLLGGVLFAGRFPNCMNEGCSWTKG